VALDGLSPALTHELTETSQRYLASAYDSVEAVLENLEMLRTARRDAGQDLRGRLTHNEEDMLRSAIVFAGAGLDATLKQLVRDSLPALLSFDDQAHDKFEGFAARRISTFEGANPKALARYLVAEDARMLLIEDYIRELTGSSLQSVQEVDRTAGALGIDDTVVRKRAAQLREVFVARNQISHELDLKSPERPGDRGRRTRPMAKSTQQAHQLLETAQLVVNAVSTKLDGAGL